jgi:mono/diheme cytochrome c family protein
MSIQIRASTAVGFALVMIVGFFMTAGSEAAALGGDLSGNVSGDNSNNNSAGNSGAASPGQRPPAFTEEQVARGKVLYQKNCQDCHGTTLDNGEFGGPPIKGAFFRQHWGSGDVAGLFGYIDALMPPDRPGQLSPQSYADLTAFLLGSNGYAAGNEELTPDPEAQRRMTMKR